MIANPAKITAASSFDSFKQYGSESVTVAVSGTISGTPGSDYATFSTSVDLGLSDTSYQVYETSTVDSRRYSLVGEYYPIRTGSIPGPVAAPYSLFFSFARSGSTLTAAVNITNPYGVTLTLVSETITLDIVPFVSPFA